VAAPVKADAIAVSASAALPADPSPRRLMIHQAQL
jgi:hypothetical protein